MKKFIILALAAIISLGANAQQASKGEQSVTIQTNGVCQKCADKFKENVPYFKGVKSYTYDMKTAKLTINYDSKKTNPDQLRQQISKLGYNADNVKADAEARAKLPACCRAEKSSGGCGGHGNGQGCGNHQAGAKSCGNHGGEHKCSGQQGAEHKCSGHQDGEHKCSGQQGAEHKCSGQQGAEHKCSGHQDGEHKCSGHQDGEHKCSGHADGKHCQGHANGHCDNQREAKPCGQHDAQRQDNGEMKATSSR